MRFVETNVSSKELKKWYGKTKNQELLEQFRDSHLDIAEVKDFPHKTSTGCASALRASVKRYSILSIGVIERNGRVFLIKK